ncbi:hypothetical protein KIN20_024737 [Parelaphostrongylus tenuis]|uniref:Uncharacterized protein n=1 Tax=Parelaphostrongylus tenuis TaxID=148309 RepID=A0AAD5MXE2_PARTN|nr:hypothetical protein KIN20_024737 [Parelaphostrongylus tenuis]
MRLPTIWSQGLTAYVHSRKFPEVSGDLCGAGPKVIRWLRRCVKKVYQNLLN